MLADSGRFPMAWLPRPCFCGDLFLCIAVLPAWYFRAVYETDNEPAMRCINFFESCNAVCRRSLPCVGMANERPGHNDSGRSYRDPLLSETLSAKEAKEADRLWWKTPRLFEGDKKGIAVRTKWQSGSADGQRRAMVLKGEPPPSATRGVPRGNPTRT